MGVGFRVEAESFMKDLLSIMQGDGTCGTYCVYAVTLLEFFQAISVDCRATGFHYDFFCVSPSKINLYDFERFSFGIR